MKTILGLFVCYLAGISIASPFDPETEVIHDRIVVEAASKEEKTAGGLYLPDAAQEKPQRGTVIAVGPGKRLDSGALSEIGINVGDTVLYGKYGGTEVSVDGKDVIILRADDVLGVIGE